MHDAAVMEASSERGNEPLLVSTTASSQTHVHTHQTPMFGSSGEILYYSVYLTPWFYFPVCTH